MTGSGGRAVRQASLALLILVAFGVSAFPSQAGCAGPVTSTEIRRAMAGGVIEVKGEYWGTECNDTGTCTSGGCSGERCTGLEPSPPATDISIVLLTRGETPGPPRVLAEGVTADEDLAFSVEVTLPDDLASGRYQLVGMSDTAIGPGGPTESFKVVEAT